ncbi:MAG: alpha-amylase family glycosyl hydrolase [Acutalibacteraceae bacterium]|nr:alpha-amylase family glycosyl hydrolase [Acutalibacteraceae bacterium]
MADSTNKALRNMMIYQIFVRNYSAEGTFKAVEQDLDRIKALGTDIIYFLPIHPIGQKNRKSTLGSPYAIKDYRKVNPEYGSQEDFKSLTNAIHNKGMKCMIDVVYNHTSPDSLLSKEHPDWFYHKADGSFGNHVGDWSDIIDLDYTNKELWDYQIETLKYWAELVDGFRCDVAPLVPIAFWERARREISQIKPDFIWLSESIEANFILYLRSMGLTALSDGEIYRAFDISYDYDIYSLWKSFIEGKEKLEEYAKAVNRQEYIYPENYVKLRFLENHDQARVRSLITDEKALLNSTAFMFFQKGTAFVYAGQEFGVSHLPSLFDKDTVDLSPENDTDLSDFISVLSKLKKSPVFTNSSYTVKAVSNDIITAKHKSTNGNAFGIFSLKGKNAVVNTSLSDGIYKNSLTNKSIEVSHGKITCTGEPVVILYDDLVQHGC